MKPRRDHRERSIRFRRCIVRGFMDGESFEALSYWYSLPAHGLGLSGSVEGIIRRALQAPKRRGRP